MKRRIRIRRRDGIRQRYWIRRKLTRNYAGGPLFDSYLSTEKHILLPGQRKGSKILRRQLEKNPELIKEIKPKTGSVSRVYLKHLPSDRIGQYNPSSGDIQFKKQIVFPPTPERGQPLPVAYPLEKVLRHESAHARQFKEEENPYLLKAHQLPFNMEQIEELKTRAKRLPLSRENILLFNTTQGPYVVTDILTDPSLLKNTNKLQRVFQELDARESEFKTPERKIKPSEEEVSKSFREVFKNGA